MTTTATARRVFEDLGPNFMTPEPVEYGAIDETDIVWEISRGRGFLSDAEIFGVTFKRLEDVRSTIPESQCVGSLSEAREVIESMRVKLHRCDHRSRMVESSTGREWKVCRCGDRLEVTR